MNVQEVTQLIRKHIGQNPNSTRFKENQEKILEKWITILYKHYDLIKKHRYGFYKKENQKVNFQDLNYIPSSQHNVVKNTTFQVYYIAFRIKKRVIHLHMYEPLGKTYHKSRLQSYLTKIMLWYSFIGDYARSVCSKTMNIHLFLMDDNKEFPRKKSKPLSELEVNSAFTTSCQPDTTIYIYRDEEWLKVLMHESFHNLGLDFSSFPENYGNHELKRFFPNVHSTVRIYESYCETWATFFHCLFQAFFSTQNKSHVSKILDKCITNLHYECAFSMIQITCIMNHNKTTYQDFLEKKVTYQEDTNVFAYYILKGILLCHFDTFFEWCKQHNKNIISFRLTNENVDSYVRLLSKLYKTPMFLGNLEKIKKEKLYDCNQGLRMTLFG